MKILTFYDPSLWVLIALSLTFPTLGNANVFTRETSTRSLDLFDIQIQYSHGLLEFLNAAANRPYADPALAAYIQKNIPLTQKMQTHLDAYSHLMLDLSNQSSSDTCTKEKTLRTLAMRAGSWNAFLFTASSLLNQEQIVVLKNIHAAFEEVYLDNIWSKYSKKLGSVRDQAWQRLNNDKTVRSTAQEISHFLGAENFQESVTLALYPSPEAIKAPSAQSFCGFISSGISNDEFYDNKKLAIWFHEWVHVLLSKNRDKYVQAEEAIFTKAKQTNAAFTRLWLEEILASILGQGFAYKQLSRGGKLDHWYNDPFINTVSKDAAEYVLGHLENGRQLSEQDVNSILAVAMRNFPTLNLEVNSILSHLAYIVDGTSIKSLAMKKSLITHLKPRSITGITPIYSPRILQSLNHVSSNIIIVATPDQKTALVAMLKKMPRFSVWAEEVALRNGNYLLTGQDHLKRFVYVIYIESPEKLDLAIQSLAALRKVSTEPTFINLAIN